MSVGSSGGSLLRGGGSSSSSKTHRRASSTNAMGQVSGGGGAYKQHGAMVMPRDAARAGVMDGVPLAPDHIYEDEGSLVGRATELVNTARDLFSALWGGVATGGRTGFSGGR